MAFCAQCGGPVQAGLAFCPACGTSVAATPAPAPTAAPVAGAPRGPVGRTQSPGNVLLLTLVTLGIYSIFYWLRVSREVDAYEGRPGHAHGKVRFALYFILGAMAASLVAVVLMISTFSGVDPADEQAAEEALGAGMGVGMMFVFVAFGLALAGSVLYFIGMWRVWSAIQADERRRDAPNPLSPGIQLLLMIIPYVSIVTTWIAIWRTQDRLNGMWAAAGAHA